MKKVFGIIFTALLVLSLAACSNSVGEMPSSAPLVENSSDTPSAAEETFQEDTKEGILIAYFSRWGNTDYPDDVDAVGTASILLRGDRLYGTNEYLAGLIQNTIGGDIHLIKTAEPYPVDFDEVVEQNREEMTKGILPPLAETTLDLSQYDTIFIGYPIWAMDAPQPILSFLQQYDFSGKTIIPFCSYNNYGAGRSYDTVAQAVPGATVLEGYAVYTETVTDAEAEIPQWLNRILKAEDAQPPKERTLPEPVYGNNRLRFSWDGKELIVRLIDNDATADLISMLPLTLPAEEYRGFQKNFTLEDGLDTGSAPGECDVFTGDLAYYAPWRHVTFFYDDFGYAEDLTPLGTVESGLEYLKDIDTGGDVTITLVG